MILKMVFAMILLGPHQLQLATLIEWNQMHERMHSWVDTGLMQSNNQQYAMHCCVTVLYVWTNKN